MAKIIIHYFSATGNTKRAVDIVAEILEKNGHQVKRVLIGTDSMATEKADSHIFAFPVLSWAAPAFVKKYLRRLPDGQRTKTAVLAVYGGDPGQALQNAESLLRRKKFDVFLTGGACYPENWTQMTNPPVETEASEIIAGGDGMARDFAENFLKGEVKLYKNGWLSNAITSFMAVLFNLMGSRFLGKTYIADSDCNHCDLCVKSCPVKSIKVAGVFRKKPHWNFQCEDCGRCINICPQKAIQVSMLRLILHVYFNIYLIYESFRLAGYAGQYFPPTYRFLGWGVSLILSLVLALFIQFVIIDRCLFILEQLPVLDKLFAWGYTKEFRRYAAPGFKPLSK